MAMRKERALTSPIIALPNGSGSSMEARAAATFPKETSDMDVKLIAVMGATVSGKSSFINLFLKESASPMFDVGYGIEACTSEVRETNTFGFEGNIFRLIDTPGTEGMEKPDSKIAMMITHFLDRQYGDGKTLDGIIYLHRLSDHSINGPIRNNLPLFMKLLGSDSVQNLLIVTNFWGDMTSDDAVMRETELSRNDTFFLPAVQKGAKMTRHNDTYSSACRILEEALSPKQSMLIHKPPGPDVVTRTYPQDGIKPKETEHDMRLQKENMEGEWHRREMELSSTLQKQHQVEMDRLRQEVKVLRDQLEASQKRERDLESEVRNLREQTNASAQTTASSATTAKLPRGVLARIFCCG